MSLPNSVADPAGARIRQADELHRRAVQENATGHPGRAERLVHRGLRLLDAEGPHDPGRCGPLRCRTASRLLATLAKATVEIHGVDPALAIMDRSLVWSACLGDGELTSFLLSQQALILFRGGRLDEAESTFGTSLAGMAEGGVDRIRVLLNRGALYVECAAIGRARADLTHAVRLSQAERHRQFERIALHNLGCLEFAAGDLPEALRLMHEGLELDGEVQQGIAHLDRSRVLLAAGLPEEADAALAQAAELFRRDRCWQDLGEVDLTRAEVALLTDRTDDARHLAGRARDRFRRHGNDRWRRAAELVLLDADRAAGRPPARLLPQASRLADEFADAGLAQQARTASLVAAELKLDLGRPAEAETLLDRVGPVTATDPIALRLQQRLVRARSLESRGLLREARRATARGLEDLASYQAQFGGIDLRSASAVHGRRLAAQDLELAVRSGRPGSVVGAVERSRAVSGRIPPVIPPPDGRTAELLSELRRAIEATTASPGRSGDRSPDPLRRRIAELQTELRSRAWLNGGSRAWRPPARLSELRVEAAEDDCELITITEVEGRLAAVRIPADGPLQWIELADVTTVRDWQHRLAADLDVLANAGLPPAIERAVTRSLRHGAAELGRLLAPAFGTADNAVVISPPSRLLSVPWLLLPQLASRPVTVAPSLSGWLRGRTTLTASPPSSTAAWTMTAVAGPGLARAAAEATTIVHRWTEQADARDLPTASPAELLDAMATSRVVHVAAHGVHRSENPMFSSLTLTGGPVFAYELDRRGQLPEHVVLSACDAGRSTVRAGEETLGLTSVLLQLGTACVVSGVARVHDDAAAELMVRYHAELTRGRSAAEALCALRDQVPTPSPFVCFGTAWGV